MSKEEQVLNEQEQQYETLSNEDTEYTQKLLSQQRRLATAKENWEEHLAEKYQLEEEDAITPDGFIIRGYKEAEASQ